MDQDTGTKEENPDWEVKAKSNDKEGKWTRKNKGFGDWGPTWPLGCRCSGCHCDDTRVDIPPSHNTTDGVCPQHHAQAVLAWARYAQVTELGVAADHTCCLAAA